jgi:predicted DNA-binding antitoxin AbrB/MazE fold protein
MNVIRAIFENGVFRPTQPVTLPDKTEVEFEPRRITPGEPDMSGIHEILSRRFESGDSYGAARHNEHQP